MPGVGSTEGDVVGRVVVHGIGQQFSGPESMELVVGAALCDGNTAHLLSILFYCRCERVLVHLSAVGGSGHQQRRPDGGTALEESDAASRFDAVFCDLLPRLYRRAVLLVGDGSAEDAVHEVYLKLAAHPQRVLEHARPYAYVIATLVSVVRDERRRQWRLVPVADVPDRADGDGAVDVHQARWQAAWLLRQLPPGQAAAVLLVDLDGYTIDEAAAALSVHRGTVSRARRRALATLRDLLKDQRQ